MPVINPNNGDICLVPGDIIKFVWQVPSAEDPQALAAIKAIKQSVSHDRRLNYQGSDFGLETMTYEDNSTLDIFCFRLYAEIAKNDKPEAGYITIGVDPATQKTVWIGDGPDPNAGTWIKTPVGAPAASGAMGTGQVVVKVAISLAIIVASISVGTAVYGSHCVRRDELTRVNDIALADIPDAIKKAAMDAIKAGDSLSLGAQVGKGFANLTQAAVVLAIAIGGLLLVQATSKPVAQAV